MLRTASSDGMTRLATFRHATPFLLVLTLTACGGEDLVPPPEPQTVFENDRFRILDITLPPGTTLERDPERSIALVSVSPDARARTQAPGADWMEASGAQVFLFNGDGSHRIQNAGDGSYQLFGIESLSGATGGGEALSSRGMELAGETSALRAYDVRLSDQLFQVSHVHDVPTVSVLVSGRIISQGAEIEEGPGSEAPTGVKQLDQPGQWVLAPPGETHYVVRLGPDPVHVVEIELR